MKQVINNLRKIYIYIYIFLIDIYFHILRKNRYFTYNAQFIKLGDYSKRKGKGNKKVRDGKRLQKTFKKSKKVSFIICSYNYIIYNIVYNMRLLNIGKE